MARYLQINYILFGTIENVATNPNNKLHPLLFLEHIHNTSQKSNYEESVFLKPKKKEKEKKETKKSELKESTFLSSTKPPESKRERKEIISQAEMVHSVKMKGK